MQGIGSYRELPMKNDELWENHTSDSFDTQTKRSKNSAGQETTTPGHEPGPAPSHMVRTSVRSSMQFS